MLYETFNQLNIFFVIFLFGFSSGLFFHAKNIFNYLFPKNAFFKITFDFLAVFCTFSVFFTAILLFNYGKTRLYLIISFILGLFIERVFISKPLAKSTLFCYTYLNEKLKQRTNRKGNKKR